MRTLLLAIIRVGLVCVVMAASVGMITGEASQGADAPTSEVGYLTGARFHASAPPGARLTHLIARSGAAIDAIGVRYVDATGTVGESAMYGGAGGVLSAIPVAGLQSVTVHYGAFWWGGQHLLALEFSYGNQPRRVVGTTQYAYWSEAKQIDLPPERALSGIAGHHDGWLVNGLELLASRSTAAGGTQSVVFEPELLTDVVPFGEVRTWVDADGDGTDDLCLVYEGTQTVECRRNRDGKLDGLIYRKRINNDLGWGDTYAFADVIGNGVAAYCRLVDRTKIRCDTFMRAGDGSVQPSVVVESDWLDPGWPGARWWVDFDGDGTKDFCRLVGSTRMACTLAKNRSFTETVYSDWFDAGWADSRAWTDVNGDGRADYCRIVGWSYLRCTLSNGDAFGLDIESGRLDDDGKSSGDDGGRWWVDFDGDGKADFCRVVSGGRVACTLASEGGFYVTVTSGEMDTGWEDSRGWADVNGDGKADYCRLTGARTTIRCTISEGQSFGSEWQSAYLDGGWKSIADGHRAWLTPRKRMGYAMYCRAVESASFKCALIRPACTPVPSLSEGDTRAIRGRALGDDPTCPRLWYAEAIGLSYDRRLPSPSVVVAVIDTGVSFVGGLAGTEVFSKSFVEGGRSDPELIDAADAYPWFMHGTAMASIIADGDIGLASGVRIANMRTGPRAIPGGTCIATLTAATTGASIINVSGGQGNDLKKICEWETVLDLIGTQNKSLVVAGVLDAHARQSQLDRDTALAWPALYHPFDATKISRDPVVRVAGLQKYGPGEEPRLYHLSNYDAGWVDIAAPGDYVAATLIEADGSHVAGSVEGNSPATAIVSAVAAVLRSCRPDATAQQVKRTLLDNADEIDALRDKVTNGRVLNAGKALRAFCPHALTPTATTR